jgi:hypothetical protein
LIQNDSGEHGLLGGDEIDKILGKQENSALIVYSARTFVPKMVKNGFDSILHISASAQEDSYSKKSRTNTKPKTFLNSCEANKNHFRPISKQACALPSV